MLEAIPMHGNRVCGMEEAQRILRLLTAEAAAGHRSRVLTARVERISIAPIMRLCDVDSRTVGAWPPLVDGRRMMVSWLN